MGLQDLYNNGLLPTCHLVHNLFKLNVQDLLYVNLVAVYLRGLFLGLYIDSFLNTIFYDI